MAKPWEVKLSGTPSISFAAYSTSVVTPPQYLFKTTAGAALTLNCASSGVTYGVSYWQE